MSSLMTLLRRHAADEIIEAAERMPPPEGANNVGLRLAARTAELGQSARSRELLVEIAAVALAEVTAIDLLRRNPARRLVPAPTL